MTITEQDMPLVLTIAGSDSGGGAGIQADLKTFSSLGVFGASAITCVTAQNPDEVSGIAAVEADVVRQQVRAVCESFPVAAAKTGMLYSAAIIEAVVAADIRQGIPILVVDPVMVSASGARLLQGDAIDALCSQLLHEARVVTPNLHEAEILCGHSISSEADLKSAAAHIGDRFDVACVAKGGHLQGAEVLDVLYDEGEEFVFRSERVDAPETHGAGCAFSAALAAFLARRELMSEAVRKAKAYVHAALRDAVRVGRHRPLNFAAGARALTDG